MGRITKKYKARSSGSFKLNITSMVDMFVMLLVFLLMSYSTSSVEVSLSNDLKLPHSNSQKEATEILKMVVSKSGVFVDSKQVLTIVDGKIPEKELDVKDNQFVRSLYGELDKQAQKSKAISKVNETVEFDGKIMVQADESLPYSTLKKILYTSTMAGFADVKLAVLASD